AQAIRDVMRKLLGSEEQPPHPDPFADRSDLRYGGRDHPDDDPWSEPEPEKVAPAVPDRAASGRWEGALGAALQAAVFWLRRQPCKRPALTAALVAVAAGGAAFLAG